MCYNTPVMALSTQIFDKKVSVGDLVRVHSRLVEGDRSRLYAFEGLVIAIKNRKENKTFTVRRIGSGGIGVERIWPVNSPWIEKIEVKSHGKVRRAKLYYLRSRKGKAALKVKAKTKKKSNPQKKVKK